MARIIQTCYIPATNTRSERIRAYFLDGIEKMLTAPFPRTLANSSAHRNIAEELLVQSGWPESKAALAAGLAESHEVLDGFIFIVR